MTTHTHNQPTVNHRHVTNKRQNRELHVRKGRGGEKRKAEVTNQTKKREVVKDTADVKRREDGEKERTNVEMTWLKRWRG